MSAPEPGERTGILGGTFDPIHNGHIALAREAKRLAGLDRVLFVPSIGYPTRTPPIELPFEQRAQLIEAAIHEFPWASLSRIERDGSLSGYLVDTLAALKSQSPRTSYTFIAGADLLRTLPHWHHADRLKRTIGFVVLTRGGHEYPEATGTGGWGIAWYSANTPDISSTMVRTLLKSATDRTSAAKLVPPPVMAYILANGLYQ